MKSAELLEPVLAEAPAPRRQMAAAKDAGDTVKEQASRCRPRGDKDGPMRASLRTLLVLRALNVIRGPTVAELSRATDISRPALYRILETLRDAGYVSVDLSRQRYYLTRLVRMLSQGFTEDDWLVQVSRPVLQALQREVVWPVDLAVFRDNAMVIGESTRPCNSMTIDRAGVGLRVGMLGSAAGRTYLAFCAPAERERILESLRQTAECGDAAVPDCLEQTLERIRLRGYGQRFREPPMATGTIAVPIQVGNRVAGCVALTFKASVLTPDEAARSHLADMREAARQIAFDLRSSHAFAADDAAQYRRALN